MTSARHTNKRLTVKFHGAITITPIPKDRSISSRRRERSSRDGERGAGAISNSFGSKVRGSWSAVAPSPRERER